MEQGSGSTAARMPRRQPARPRPPGPTGETARARRPARRLVRSGHGSTPRCGARARRWPGACGPTSAAAPATGVRASSPAAGSERSTTRAPNPQESRRGVL